MRVRLRWLLVLIVWLPLGCSKGLLPDDALPTYPTTGTLTYNGEPMDGVAIIFHRVDPPSKWRTPSPSGRSDINGRYTFNTYLTGDGVPEGEYIVTIYWPEARNGKSPALESLSSPLAPDRLKQAYADRKTTKLRATVETKDNVIDFHLP